SVWQKCRLIARRDRYHRLEFASACGAVMRRWLARDGLLDVLLVRVDALRPATHVRPRARRSTVRPVPKYRFKIYWSVPTYRLDCVAVGYSGVATGAFWDSCWWLRVGHRSSVPFGASLVLIQR